MFLVITPRGERASVAQPETIHGDEQALRARLMQLLSECGAFGDDDYKAAVLRDCEKVRSLTYLCFVVNQHVEEWEAAVGEHYRALPAPVEGLVHLFNAAIVNEALTHGTPPWRELGKLDTRPLTFEGEPKWDDCKRVDGVDVHRFLGMYRDRAGEYHVGFTDVTIILAGMGSPTYTAPCVWATPIRQHYAGIGIGDLHPEQVYEHLVSLNPDRAAMAREYVDEAVHGNGPRIFTERAYGNSLERVADDFRLYLEASASMPSGMLDDPLAGKD